MYTYSRMHTYIHAHTHRFPRVNAEWAKDIEWGAHASWKERFKHLLQMNPVVLWVDDIQENVE
jgi:hypothetical protein